MILRRSFLSQPDQVSSISVSVNLVLIIIFQSSRLACSSPTSLFAVMIPMMSAISAAANSYLFLIRVLAVHNNSRRVGLFFGAGWLAVVGTGVAFHFSYQFSVSGAHIYTYIVQGLLLNFQPTLKRLGYSQRCYLESTEAWAAIALWVRAGYNTSIYVAISARIASYALPDRSPTRKNWIQSFFSAQGLPQLCRDLLHGGQSFYLCVISTSSRRFNRCMPYPSLILGM